MTVLWWALLTALWGLGSGLHAAVDAVLSRSLRGHGSHTTWVCYRPTQPHVRTWLRLTLALSIPCH